VRKSVYIETSIPSYLTARKSSDIKAMAWQEITNQWWKTVRVDYDLFVSDLVIVEASAGDQEAAAKRIEPLRGIRILPVDMEAREFADQLISQGAIPTTAKADALHIAVAAMHRVDYLLTWNFRHINNAAKKPIIRSICATIGHPCPEICTPTELLPENENHVRR